MKKIVLFVLSCLLITSLFAQDSMQAPPKKPTVNLAARSGDHFLIQYGYTNWVNTPDSINTGGFSHSFNIYLMFDFPFRSTPKLSAALGLGVSSDHIIFKETYIDIKGQTLLLHFDDQSNTDHFRKTKLATAYFEVPVEFRYASDPANSGKSFKFALGVKGGTLIRGHTRNKTLQNANDNTINDYLMKEASKRYFNTIRMCGIARVGYGHFTVYGSYQFTTLFKEGVAANVRPYSIGLTLSGL